jgi:hypothetical protein
VFGDLNSAQKYDVVNQIRFYADKSESFFANYPLRVKFTIIECILFAMTEGNITQKMNYGIPE